MQTLRKACAVMSVLLGLMLASQAMAQTTIGNPTATGSVPINDAFPIAGEIITPPPDVGALAEFTFWLETRFPATTTDIRASVYEWAGTPAGVVGPPLWTGTVSVIDHLPQPYTFHPNVVLDPSKRYILLMEQMTPGQFSGAERAFVDNDPGGHLATFSAGVWNENPAVELRFSATFAPPPPAIPTLGEWAMILLGLMLAGGGALYLQGRSRGA